MWCSGLVRREKKHNGTLGRLIALEGPPLRTEPNTRYVSTPETHERNLPCTGPLFWMFTRRLRESILLPDNSSELSTWEVTSINTSPRARPNRRQCFSDDFQPYCPECKRFTSGEPSSMLDVRSNVAHLALATNQDILITGNTRAITCVTQNQPQNCTS